MLRGEFIEKVVSSGKIPRYITNQHLGRILDIIESGKQHPNSPSCDMVIEVASGAFSEDVVPNWESRGTEGPSLYAKIYKFYKSECK